MPAKKKKIDDVGIKSETEDVSINVEDLKGIGPKTAEKLHAIGINTVYDLLIRGSSEAIDATEIPEGTIESAIKASADIVNKLGLTRKSNLNTLDLFNYKHNMTKLKSQAKNLDELLGGGINLEALTEVYGEFGSGKTQFCYTLAVEAIHKHDWNVLWLDCEDTFDPDRIISIVKARGYETEDEKIMEKYFPKIEYRHAPNTDLLISEVNHMTKNLLEKKVKLIILDGAIGQFREEFLGRGNLAGRQNNLARFMNIIKNTAYYLNCAVVLTNQVQADPSAPRFMDPIKPIGGNVVGHASTHRIYFKKSGSKRIARMVDSPNTESKEVFFALNAKGVDDPEE